MNQDITEQELKGEGCSSDKDLVTFVDWIDNKPSVFINFIANPGKPGRLNCYDGDSLRTWLLMPENTFAEWVPHDNLRGMNDMGYGGGPELSNLFVKLYTGEYLKYDENVRLLKRRMTKPVKFDANFMGMKRIGNTQGTFGVGDTHGQVPGYGIYQLRLISKVDEMDLEDDEITEQQEVESIDDDIIMGERTYTGMEDEEYYRNDYSSDQETESTEIIPDSLFDQDDEVPYSPYRPPRPRLSQDDSESSSSSSDEMELEEEEDNEIINNPPPIPVTPPIVRSKAKSKVTLPPPAPPRWVPVKAKGAVPKMKM